MKTVNFLKLTAAALLCITGTASALTIVGSDHDLGTGTSNGNEQVCVYCHTPHNALQDATKAVPPLWNKVFTTETFTIYTSPTLDNAIGQPEGVSLACLSCHDGTLALDAMINPPTNFTPNDAPMGGGSSANLGTDLSNDHPISVGYSVGLGSELEPVATVKAILPLFLGQNNAGGDQVECGTCHNVHDNAIKPFMRIANNNSDLCLTCHIK